MEREDIINGYFEQRLSDLELKEFERRVVEEPDFAEEVEFRKQLQAAITQNERLKIKSQLQNFELQREKKSPPKNKNIRWLAIAASFVVLLGLSKVYFDNRTVSPNDLYERYYQPFPNVISPVVRGGQDLDELAKAFSLYEAAEYKEALKIFSKYSDVNSIFYAGLSEMELNNYAKAIPFFDDVIKQKSTFESYAKWYKALAYIKLNKKDEALKLLQSIENYKEFDLSEQVILLINDLH